MGDLIPYMFDNRLSLSRSIFDEVDRALNDAFGKDFFPNSLKKSSYPKMNIYDKDDCLKIDTYIPEVDRDHISVKIEDSILTISGKAESDTEQNGNKYYCREVSRRAFSRSVRLPENIEEDKVKADHSNGMLKISIPYVKKDEPKKKLIDVKID